LNAYDIDSAVYSLAYPSCKGSEILIQE